MHFIIGLLAVGQILFGLNVFNVAASAMHEILAAVLFGSGSICLALAFLIYKSGKPS
ncbi:hypothetical protein [uncultured Paracoccus sp.]|uniref:hypothetical protein n=1 Tax=uncultured Paracoccus sp. TaxID=189685 RepID=UPI0025DC32DC|nr:hypothetical protein [uncultured Paracoccus sp.]